MIQNDPFQPAQIEPQIDPNTKSRKYRVAYQFNTRADSVEEPIGQSEDSLYYEIQRKQLGGKGGGAQFSQREYLAKTDQRFKRRRVAQSNHIPEHVIKKSKTPKARRRIASQSASFKKRKNLTGGETWQKKEEEYVPVYVVGDQIFPVEEYRPSGTFGKKRSPPPNIRASHGQAITQTEQEEGGETAEGSHSMEEGEDSHNEDEHAQTGEYSEEDEEEGSMGSESQEEPEEDEMEEDEEEDGYEETEEFQEVRLRADDGAHGKDLELIEAAQRIRERSNEEDFVVNGNSSGEEVEEVHTRNHGLPRPPKGQRKIQFFK